MRGSVRGYAEGYDGWGGGLVVDVGISGVRIAAREFISTKLNLSR